MKQRQTKLAQLLLQADLYYYFVDLKNLELIVLTARQLDDYNRHIPQNQQVELCYEGDELVGMNPAEVSPLTELTSWK